MIRRRPADLSWSRVCDASIISVAATTNLSKIAVATVGRSLYVFDGDGRDMLGGPVELRDEGWATAMAADGSLIAAGTANKRPAAGTLELFAGDGARVGTFNADAPVWGVAIAPDCSVVAATTWSNEIVLASEAGGEYHVSRRIHVDGAEGLYGVDFTSDGGLVVAAYNLGLIHLPSLAHEPEILHRAREGFYNVAYIDGQRRCAIAARSGRIALIDLATAECVDLARLSQRALCGLSASNGGKVFVAGGFDGVAHVCTGAGRSIESVATEGEIWTTAMSADGGRYCFGSGDSVLRVYDSVATEAALEEIEAATRAVAGAPRDSDRLDAALGVLVQLYLRYGMASFGARELWRLRNDEPGNSGLFDRWRKRLLEDYVKVFPDAGHAHYVLARISRDQGDHAQAARQYLRAAGVGYAEGRALTSAVRAFERQGLRRAAATAARRARTQRLDDQALHVLYNLARSYEDQAMAGEATTHYEVVVAWNPDYRDAWDRLGQLSQASADAPKSAAARDYTGLTASYLGPDTPREVEVDPALVSVVKARDLEHGMAPDERREMEASVRELVTDKDYIRTVTARGLDYSARTLEMYDSSVPEDEIKKVLETVNLLYLLRAYHLDVSDSLDIGSASGRYPGLLARRGVHACGVDREREAVAYATRMHAQTPDGYPRFTVADARRLPYEEASFDLVTCMMGTFAHIPNGDQADVIKEVFRVLRPGGVAVISTWDPECDHTDYLAIYNEVQKREILSNALSAEEIGNELLRHGFQDERTRSFCLLPSVFVYDLGLETLTEQDLVTAIRADLAAKAVFRQRRGAMFLAAARKPAEPEVAAA